MSVNPTNKLIWPFAEKVVRLFLGTFLTLIIAREMGPDQFGIYSTIFAIIMLFSALAGLGLKDVIVDEIASGRKDANDVLSAATFSVLIVSIFLSVVFLTLTHVMYSLNGAQFWVASFLVIILISKVFELLLFGLEAKTELRSISLAQQISIFCGAIGKIIVIFVSASAISLAAVTGLEFIILSIALIILASHRGVSLFKSKVQMKYAIALVKRSWPLATSSLAVMCYFYLDQIMIALLMDSESVGVYAVATRISQQLYILPAILVGAYFPRLIRINSQSLQAFEDGFKALTTVLIALALAIWFLILLLSKPFLDFILGTQFSESINVVKLHAFGVVFVSLNVISGRWYIMQNLQLLTLVRQLLTAGLNVVLNFILIPLFGLTGAVYATLISLAFLAYGFDLIGTSTRNLLQLKLSSTINSVQIRKLKGAFRDLKTL